MADYAKMYHRLFDSQTRAIEILQQGQIEAEEMYISAPDPDIRLLDPRKQDDDKE